jgi:hypothetical protein
MGRGVTAGGAPVVVEPPEEGEAVVEDDDDSGRSRRGINIGPRVPGLQRFAPSRVVSIGAPVVGVEGEEPGVDTAEGGV